ncbi:kynureninase [Novosphingobium lentum]|uniref:kynureninase n=1 Tax=Novosphingobium lentum TaxID=145287 RepID=UPI000836B05C|nr:kynureninase [Novosphingobium lentum]
MTAADLDRADPLAPFRERFLLPEGVIYLDGNSLGALPRDTPGRIEQVMRHEWGDGLIGSWNDAGWVQAPQRIGDKIARLIGADPGEVVACDSTSINVFKALTAALALNPARRVMLTEAGNFPTDLYMMQGIAALCPGAQVRTVAADAIARALTPDVAVLLLTQVHYKTGAMRDMVRITAQAQAAGALVIWDLSHSAGAFPVDLNGCNADLAVGCGYKFLNGGPGAPGFLFCAARHQDRVMPALSGWFGHAAPFAFRDDYAAATGITRFLVGTPPILGLAALEVGVDMWLEADLSLARTKSLQLGARFQQAMEPLCQRHGFSLASPVAAARRGSQISYAHPQGYPIMRALAAHGVIGDFRDPDVLRFGLTPLTLRFGDIDAAVAILDDIMTNRRWDTPDHHARRAVT